MRSNASPTTCAAGCSPSSSTHTRCRTRRRPRSRRASDRSRDDDERREGGRERDRRDGSGERPTVHRAHAYDKEQHTPREKGEVDGTEDGVAAAVVVSAGAKEIGAVDGDAHGPEDDERERERRRREPDQVPRAAPAAVAAEPPGGAEQQG